MIRSNTLLSLQLEWLETIKYDEYLTTINNFKNNPTKENQLLWDVKEREYLKLLSNMDQIISE